MRPYDKSTGQGAYAYSPLKGRSVPLTGHQQKSRMPGLLVRSFRCTQSSYDRRARLGGTQCIPSLPWSPPSALNRAPGHCTNRRIPTQKATERRCAMKAWLQHSALSAVVLAFLPLIELVSPAAGRAEPPPPCPPGMYWNFATVVCEFPPPPPLYIDPWLPVYVPDLVDVDLDLDVDIPIPGPPGIGRPGPAPRPRGGGGGRRGGGRR
jgi:hypothetical protein